MYQDSCQKKPALLIKLLNRRKTTRISLIARNGLFNKIKAGIGSKRKERKILWYYCHTCGKRTLVLAYKIPFGDFVLLHLITEIFIMDAGMPGRPGDITVISF